MPRLYDDNDNDWIDYVQSCYDDSAIDADDEISLSISDDEMLHFPILLGESGIDHSHQHSGGRRAIL